jgi:putative ABC transport system ATP-binding protein
VQPTPEEGLEGGFHLTQRYDDRDVETLQDLVIVDTRSTACGEWRIVAVQLTGVTKTYQLGDEQFHALNGVSLAVESGEFVAMMGPSGSGKSTLANIIGGLDRPDQGDVVVDGENLAGMRDNELSRFRNQKVGFVFQAFNLKGDNTALENVMLPLVFARMRPSERKARASECLERVGLGPKMDRRASQLSGGERQRVAIARGLAMRPSLIIADEPTGNLDSARGEEVIEMLAGLHRDGITLLMITHDATIGARAQRIVEVFDGTLHEKVKGSSGRLSARRGPDAVQ